MRARRLASGLLVPALLAGLVLLLATLQYRWLGQVSEAEREQLQQSLTQRARDFADEFDREVSQVYGSLRMTSDVLASRAWAPWSESYDRWRAAAKFPGLVRAVYLAQVVNERTELRAYDPASRAFAETPLAQWPPGLEGMPQLRATTADVNGTRILSLAFTPVAGDGSALVMPILAEGFGTAGEARQAAGPGPAAAILAPLRTFVVAQLDREYIRRTMLPALVAKHFPDDGGETYRVAVLKAAGDALFARGFASGRAIDPAKCDVALPLFAIRVDLAHDLAPSGEKLMFRATTTAPAPAPAAGTPPPAPGGGQISIVMQRGTGVVTSNKAFAGPSSGLLRVTGPGWRIVLQHASGSLDVAVARARRRNLALSFSILAVLVAGVVLVVVNARRAETLAAKQVDFVATVTHELRTPLAVIRSAAQNLSAGVVTEPAQARRYGELIDKEGRRLTDTVEQVLAYAGLEGGRTPRTAQPVDVAHLVAEVLESSQPALDEAGFLVEYDPAGKAGLPVVTGDEDGLRLVVQNLVSNAIKHGADGRWIGVSVDGAVHGGRPEIRIVVRDRGAGIDAADTGRVFEPFFRGRRALESQVRGNGLGLSLVKRIVEAHGGRVIVKSAQGAGAEFVVYLPAREAGETTVNGPEAAQAAASGRETPA